jgi:hypothetical protein
MAAASIVALAIGGYVLVVVVVLAMLRAGSRPSPIEAALNAEDLERWEAEMRA